MKNWQIVLTTASLTVLVLVAIGASFAAIGTGSTEIVRYTRGGVVTQIMDNADNTMSVCTTAPDAKMIEYAALHTQFNEVRYAALLRTLPTCTEEQHPDWRNCNTPFNRAYYVAYHDNTLHSTEYGDLFQWNVTRNLPSSDFGG